MWWMTGKYQVNPDEDQGDEGWTTLRYRKVYRQFLIPSGLGSVPLVITECGIDPKSDVPIAKQEPRPLPDRKALDDIVFDALGLSEDERKEVYRAVCQLVWERTSKARSM